MTLINYAIAHDRGVMCADSSMGDAQKRAVFPYTDHKLIPLPSARCVFSLTGPLALRNALALQAGHFTSTEAAIEHIPRRARDAWLSTRTLETTGYNAASAYLVGWSDTHERVVAATFRSDRDFAAELRIPDRPQGEGQSSSCWGHSPGIGLPMGFRYVIDDAAMLELAQHQVAHYRAKDPCVALGGPLVLCEVTRDALVMRVIGDLGMSEDWTALQSIPVSPPSPEPVTASFLEPEAAAKVMPLAPSNGTHSWSSSSGGIGPQQAVGQIVYVNTSARAVHVECSCSGVAGGTGGGGTGGGRLTLQPQLNFNAGSVTTRRVVYLNTIDIEQNFGGILTEQIAAGDTATFTLYSVLELKTPPGTWNGGSISWADVEMRLTAVHA